jgi:phage nucleotide-binding protein
MAIVLKRTGSVSSDGVKMLVYGQAGAGKTTLLPTLPNPVVLSAESGLLSIAGADLPYIEITSLESLRDAYAWCVSSQEADQFESIGLDSISEIAEVVLTAAKKTAKDPRQAYGELADQMSDLIRAFRDIKGKNVYFSAKLEKSNDEMGRIMYAPMMPGAKVGQSLPYYFDLVMPLRIERDESGNAYRVLMTQSDGLWQAKCRGFALDAYEQADLGAIIKKVTA